MFCRGSDHAHRGDKAVAAPPYGFNKPGIRSGIAQRLAQLADRCADAALEIDKCILRPQLLPQLFPRYHPARLTHQQRQDAERKVLQRNSILAFFQLGGAQICNEEAEPDGFLIMHTYHPSTRKAESLPKPVIANYLPVDPALQPSLFPPVTG